MNINIWWFFWAININDLSRKMTVWAPRGAILHHPLSFEISITRVALGRGGAGNLCHLAASPSTPIPCLIHSFPTFSHFSLFSQHVIPTNPNDITRKVSSQESFSKVVLILNMTIKTRKDSFCYDVDYDETFLLLITIDDEDEKSFFNGCAVQPA